MHFDSASLQTPPRAILVRLVSILVGLLWLLPSVARAQPPSNAQPPANARAALDLATAAYSFGDMEAVVTSVRPVAEGDLPSTVAERGEALRLLGTSLFLTGRREGARVAFLDLLRLDPGSRLDPRTTRPDVMAFFQTLQAERAAELEERERNRSRDRLLWSFAPPFAQFRGGRPTRGWILIGTATAAFATLATTKVLLESWEQPFYVHDPSQRSRNVKAINYASMGLLGATYVAGVVEALLNRNVEPPPAKLSITVQPGGLGLSGRF